MPPQESDKHEYDEDAGEEGEGEHAGRINNSHSEHEEFLHPNMIKEEDPEDRIRKS